MGFIITEWGQFKICRTGLIPGLTGALFVFYSQINLHLTTDHLHRDRHNDIISISCSSLLFLCQLNSRFFGFRVETSRQFLWKRVKFKSRPCTRFRLLWAEVANPPFHRIVGLDGSGIGIWASVESSNGKLIIFNGVWGDATPRSRPRFRKHCKDESNDLDLTIIDHQWPFRIEESLRHSISLEFQLSTVTVRLQ